MKRLPTLNPPSPTARRVCVAALIVSSFVFCLSAIATPERGYPCTTYKPQDIARARQNLDRHEWARNTYAWTKRQADRYLEMDSDELRARIPEQTPLLGVKCPVCGNGPWYAYKLAADGKSLTCRGCGTSWDYDPDDTVEDWTIQSVIRTYRMQSVVFGCEALGIAYQIEGDIRYAQRAAAIVLRMAEVFAGYRMNKVNANVWMEEDNHPYYGKIIGWKFREANCLKSVLLAYDLIHDSGALTPEQCRFIDDELVRYVRDYFIASFGEGGYLDTLSIQDQGYSYWCIAATAALLGDEETLQTIVEMYRQMLDPVNGIFYEDGTFFQGTWAYESQFLGGSWDIPEVISGNLDADIYTDPQCALLEDVLTWYLDSTFPNGSMPAVADAHVGGRPALRWSEIAHLRYGNRQALRHLADRWGQDLDGGSMYSLFFRDPEFADDGASEDYGTQSTHLTGMGFMILRHGESKASQTMAFLDYGPYQPSPHKQRDYGNIGLWAAGMEMISELGYNHNPLWVKRFQVTPLAHNTVLEVGSQNQKGTPLIWCVTPGPKLAEAGLPPANSRFVALLPRNNSLPIVADIFRVRGEQASFTWAMHARSDDLATTGLANPQPAEVPEPLRDGTRGEVTEQLAATWTFAGERPRGLLMMMPTREPMTVTVAQCPAEEDAIQAVHVGGGALKPGEEVPYRGHVQVTLAGPDAVFVAVHVPYEGHEAPPVTAKWRTVPGRPDVVALEIDADGERFLVVHAPEPGPVEYGPLQFEGRAAVVHMTGERVHSLCLANGTHAQYGDADLSLPTEGNAYWSEDE